MKNPKQIVLPDALNGLDDFFVQSEAKIENQGIWAEPQLYLLPFCVPQDKASDRFRSIKITETFKLGDQFKQRTFRVNPDPELGLPGSFDLDVMTGVYRLADVQMERSHEVLEFIELDSFSSFLNSIGSALLWQICTNGEEALKRLMSTMCISEGFFYSKPRDLYIAESFSFIAGVEIAGEQDFNGQRFERTRVKLHPFIRENLNANFRTLIDFDYLRSLRTDIAKPIALHLAYRVFKSKKAEWEPEYEWLAQRIAVKVYSEMKAARKQFKTALDELRNTGLIHSWEWRDNRIQMLAGPSTCSNAPKSCSGKRRMVIASATPATCRAVSNCISRAHGKKKKCAKKHSIPSLLFVQDWRLMAGMRSLKKQRHVD